MRETQLRNKKKIQPGARALTACGDGFWEFDLIEGSAWFSDWFYRRITCPIDLTRGSLLNFQPLMHPATWQDLMANLRDHLEQGRPLDVKVRVEVGGDQIQWWQIRGAAVRNDVGHPVHLAGSARDVSADVDQQTSASTIRYLRRGFDALPMAAALLDAKNAIVEANRLWCEVHSSQATQVIARLSAMDTEGALEFSLDPRRDIDGVTRDLQVRAVPFQHDGARHWVITLDDRTADRT
jgi:PAS domain-containing protein